MPTRSFDETKAMFDTIYGGDHQYLTNLPPTEKQLADKARTALIEKRCVIAGAATVAASYGILAFRVRPRR